MTVTETPTPLEPPSTETEAQAPRKGNGFAIAALILGVLVLSSISPYIGVFIALVAFVLAFVLTIVSLATARRRKGLPVGGRFVTAVIVGYLSLTVGAGILFSSWLGRVGEMPKRGICAANLNGVGKGIVMYASSYDDASPPTLRELIEDGQPADLLVCPSTGTQVREGPPYFSDYFYLPPDPNASDETIVACDFKGNHDDWRNALFADSHMAGFTEQAFQALLEEPHNATFAAALRAAESERGRLESD